MVTFALDQLKEVDKDDGLNVAEFLTAARSVVALKAKGPCEQALKLVAQVVKFL